MALIIDEATGPLKVLGRRDESFDLSCSALELYRLIGIVSR